MIADIQYKGLLVGEADFPGERKCDGVVPAHAGCIRAGRDRWVLFYATLDERGWDAVKSIVYQVRAQAPDGPLLTERLIVKGQSGWDPFGKGDSYWKCHGDPILFGVPKGARQHGQVMPHHNRFVAKWYSYAHLEKDGKLIHPINFSRHDLGPLNLLQQTMRVEWIQFGLNEKEDDIVILRGPETLRQNGYENGEAFCSLGPGFYMNHALGGVVPFSEDCSEWIECAEFVQSHEGGGRVAAIRYVFNRQTELYEWTETGRMAPDAGNEASINRHHDEWLISLRVSGRKDPLVLWYRTPDPFKEFGKAFYVRSSWGPKSSYRCADGVLRLFTHDPDNPYGNVRNPLYCWDVNPADFSCSNRRIILDCHAAGLPFHIPFIDLAHVFEHQGNRQIVAYRGIPRRQTHNNPEACPPMTPEALAHSGIHYSEMIYTEKFPDSWEFGPEAE